MRRIFNLKIKLPLKTIYQLEDLREEFAKFKKCDPKTISIDDLIIDTVEWTHKLIWETNMKEDE